MRVERDRNSHILDGARHLPISSVEPYVVGFDVGAEQNVALSGDADGICRDSSTGAISVADAEPQFPKMRDNCSVFGGCLRSALDRHRHGIDEKLGVRYDGNVGLCVWIGSNHEGILVVVAGGSSIHHGCNQWGALCLWMQFSE